jgi:diadenosine tetraphosphate (Ap4A) HIT family hydrolase
VFAVDPAFDAASEPLVSLPLCEARLQNDARFPWLILIPRIAGVVEIEDLGPEDRARLLDEAVRAGQAVRAMGLALGRPAVKLNLGLLGNITRQLHVHIVGRRDDDPCWPGPVWGQAAYDPHDLAAIRAAAIGVLKP